MTESILVIGIVAVAGVFVLRRVLALRKGVSGCGCGSGCSGADKKACCSQKK